MSTSTKQPTPSLPSPASATTSAPAGGAGGEGTKPLTRRQQKQIDRVLKHQAKLHAVRESHQKERQDAVAAAALERVQPERADIAAAPATDVVSSRFFGGAAVPLQRVSQLQWTAPSAGSASQSPAVGGPGPRDAFPALPLSGAGRVSFDDDGEILGPDAVAEAGAADAGIAVSTVTDPARSLPLLQLPPVHTSLNTPPNTYLSVDGNYYVHRHAPGYMRDNNAALVALMERALGDIDPTALFDTKAAAASTTTTAAAPRVLASSAVEHSTGHAEEDGDVAPVRPRPRVAHDHESPVKDLDVDDGHDHDARGPPARIVASEATLKALFSAGTSPDRPLAVTAHRVGPLLLLEVDPAFTQAQATAQAEPATNAGGPQRGRDPSPVAAVRAPSVPKRSSNSDTAAKFAELFAAPPSPGTATPMERSFSDTSFGPDLDPAALNMLVPHGGSGDFQFDATSLALRSRSPAAFAAAAATQAAGLPGSAGGNRHRALFARLLYYTAEGALRLQQPEPVPRAIMDRPATHHSHHHEHHHHGAGKHHHHDDHSDTSSHHSHHSDAVSCATEVSAVSTVELTRDPNHSGGAADTARFSPKVRPSNGAPERMAELSLATPDASHHELREAAMRTLLATGQFHAPGAGPMSPGPMSPAGLQLQEGDHDEEEQLPDHGRSEPAPDYTNVLRWRLNELDLVIGVDTPILESHTGERYTLRLRPETAQPTEAPVAAPLRAPLAIEGPARPDRWADESDNESMPAELRERMANPYDSSSGYATPAAPSAPPSAFPAVPSAPPVAAATAASPQPQAQPGAGAASGVALSSEEALDYWFDATVTNSRSVAIALHKHGVISGYHAVTTGELLQQANKMLASFALGFTNKTLTWLLQQCDTDGASYVALRRPGASSLELFRLPDPDAQPRRKRSSSQRRGGSRGSRGPSSRSPAPSSPPPSGPREPEAQADPALTAVSGRRMALLCLRMAEHLRSVPSGAAAECPEKAAAAKREALVLLSKAARAIAPLVSPEDFVALAPGPIRPVIGQPMRGDLADLLARVFALVPVVMAQFLESAAAAKAASRAGAPDPLPTALEWARCFVSAAKAMDTTATPLATALALAFAPNAPVDAAPRETLEALRQLSVGASETGAAAAVPVGAAVWAALSRMASTLSAVTVAAASTACFAGDSASSSPDAAPAPEAAAATAEVSVAAVNMMLMARRHLARLQGGCQRAALALRGATVGETEPVTCGALIPLSGHEANLATLRRRALPCVEASVGTIAGWDATLRETLSEIGGDAALAVAFDLANAAAVATVTAAAARPLQDGVAPFARDLAARLPSLNLAPPVLPELPPQDGSEFGAIGPPSTAPPPQDPVLGLWSALVAATAPLRPSPKPQKSEAAAAKTEDGSHAEGEATAEEAAPAVAPPLTTDTAMVAATSAAYVAIRAFAVLLQARGSSSTATATDVPSEGKEAEATKGPLPKTPDALDLVGALPHRAELKTGAAQLLLGQIARKGLGAMSELHKALECATSVSAAAASAPSRPKKSAPSVCTAVLAASGAAATRLAFVTKAAAKAIRTTAGSNRLTLVPPVPFTAPALALAAHSLLAAVYVHRAAPDADAAVAAVVQAPQGQDAKPKRPAAPTAAEDSSWRQAMVHCQHGLALLEAAGVTEPSPSAALACTLPAVCATGFSQLGHGPSAAMPEQATTMPQLVRPDATAPIPIAARALRGTAGALALRYADRLCGSFEEAARDHPHDLPQTIDDLAATVHAAGAPRVAQLLGLVAAVEAVRCSYVPPAAAAKQRKVEVAHARSAHLIRGLTALSGVIADVGALTGSAGVLVAKAVVEFVATCGPYLDTLPLRDATAEAAVRVAKAAATADKGGAKKGKDKGSKDKGKDKGSKDKGKDKGSKEGKGKGQGRKAKQQEEDELLAAIDDADDSTSLDAIVFRLPPAHPKAASAGAASVKAVRSGLAKGTPSAAVDPDAAAPGVSFAAMVRALQAAVTVLVVHMSARAADVARAAPAEEQPLLTSLDVKVRWVAQAAQTAVAHAAQFLSKRKAAADSDVGRFEARLKTSAGKLLHVAGPAPSSKPPSTATVTAAAIASTSDAVVAALRTFKS